MQDKRPKTFWILKREQIRELTFGRRHDIIDRLAASEPMSIKQLAAAIGAKPSALYHHVRKLLSVGLVIEAGTRVAKRKREQLYTTPAPRMRLARALADGRNDDLMIDIVASLTRQMSRDFQTGSRSAAKTVDGQERNFGFFRLLGRPNAADLARINTCLLEIAEILWKSGDPEADLISFGWTLAPLE